MFSQTLRKIDRVVSIPISKITPNPGQPRKFFDQSALETLAQSITSYGIISPLTVRKSANGLFELVAGERRLRAATLAGLRAVPCIISEADARESAILALVENLQRRDLNFFEEALGVERLMTTYAITQEEAAACLSKGQSTIANKLRLLRLSEGVRQKILENDLTERHARALLRLSEDKQQEEALKKIVDRHLNVAQTEQLVETMATAKPKPMRKQVVRDVRIFLNTINHALSVMKLSGIAARSVQQETADAIEYKITIPKF